MFGRLFVADAKMIVRNKQSLFWAMAFPLLFATVFGLFSFDDIGQAEVAVFGDPAARAPFEAAITAIEDTGGEDKGPLTFTKEYPTEPKAREALADGEIDFVLFVPANGDVVLEFNEAEADRNAVFRPIIERVVDQLNLRLADVEPAYRLEQRGISGISVGYYDFILPGLVGMAVMSYGIIGLGSTIAQYRGQRILKRILATPLRPSVFLLSIVAAHLVLAVIQSAMVLAWGVLLFDGTVRGNVLWIVLLVLLGNLTFLNIGFMVAAFTDNAEAASGMGNAIALPMMFLSGVFFPTAGLPAVMKVITAVLPLRPMVDAIRGISLEGESLTAYGPQLAQLAAWAVVTFFIASRVFRFERV